jgi:hypothetical protein
MLPAPARFNLAPLRTEFAPERLPPAPIGMSLIRAGTTLAPEKSPLTPVKFNPAPASGAAKQV